MCSSMDVDDVGSGGKDVDDVGAGERDDDDVTGSGKDSPSFAPAGRGARSRKRKNISQAIVDEEDHAQTQTQAATEKSGSVANEVRLRLLFSERSHRLISVRIRIRLARLLQSARSTCRFGLRAAWRA